MATSQTLPLQGRHALVTGAARGIGAAIAHDAAAAITGQSISVSAGDVTT
jgi:NAD(P)-dependent dehydrogenase (short-subunit alcohol dehydrogenase family)